MSGGVIDGQAVSQGITNPAFIFKNADDTTTQKLGFHSSVPADGKFIDSIQKGVNNLNDSVGLDLSGNGTAEVDATGKTYGTNQRALDGQTHKVAIGSLDGAFHPSTGHMHTGVTGDAPPIPSTAVSPIILRGYPRFAPAITGATGTSTDVSTQMSGKTPSSGSTVEGVVVTSSYNKCILKQGSGTNYFDDYVDGSGNIVYGRITEAAGVWTLSYYVLIAAVETVYSFASASDIIFIYQELFNPIVDAPVYNEFASIPSDLVTVVPGIRSDNVAIASSATSKAITFSSALASASYGVNAVLSNTVDAAPMFQPVTITAQSASGFTASWNVALDSGNYKLEYIAAETT